MSASESIVLITGATRGLGLATAKAIASSFPASLILCGCRTLPSTPLDANLTNLIPVRLDVTDPSSVDAAVEEITQKHHKLDILINNAGVSSKSPDLTTNLTECVSVNLLGAARVTEAFLPLLEKSPSPQLLFISTVLGSISARSDPAHPFAQIQATGYRASKAGLNMLLACYAQDPARGKFKVFGICPGFLATELNGPPEMMRKMGAAEPEKGAELVLSVLQGERDADKGKVVCDGGVRDW
ncbi:short-chain dehydrogenase protein [Rutstroemia sp. NJR-2017a WRK4]|nr:short-chain dehydrogenase protein [Rutstroemia sp. NJR-2017a WRK4]